MFHGRAWKVTSFGDPEKALQLQDTCWPGPLPGTLSTLADSGLIATPVGSTYDFTDVPAMVARLASPPPGKSIVMMK